MGEWVMGGDGSVAYRGKFDPEYSSNKLCVTLLWIQR